VVGHETPPLVGGQLRKLRAHRGDRLRLDDYGQEVGIGKVSVVVRFFLAAHRTRLVLVGIIEPRLLRDSSAAFEELDLTRRLDFDGFLDESERVEILELRARTELLLSRASNGDVGIAPKRSFLHVAVANAEVTDESMNGAHIRAGFRGRAQIGRRYDLEEWRAGAIQIDARHPVEVLVKGFSGILLEMRACDPDAFCPAGIEDDVDVPPMDDG
jgi:hypothetical protein